MVVSIENMREPESIKRLPEHEKIITGHVMLHRTMHTMKGGTGLSLGAGGLSKQKSRWIAGVDIGCLFREE